MISKFARISVITVFGLSLSALAQTTPAASSAVPNAPSAAAAGPAATGTRVGTISIEQALAACNEGQRDLGELSKKLEPKQTQLKGANDEIDSLKKQLTTQGDKMNDDAKNALVKQIESKQKAFERFVQDAREEAQAQQGEIMQRILKKMAPVIAKYASDYGYGLLIDTSQPWPQGPVIMAGAGFDITQQVVDAYNVKSGVAAPLDSVSKPAAPKPATKPATAPATKPPATTNPPKQ